jgi:hypothetical protein
MQTRLVHVLIKHVHQMPDGSTCQQQSTMQCTCTAHMYGQHCKANSHARTTQHADMQRTPPILNAIAAQGKTIFAR